MRHDVLDQAVRTSPPRQVGNQGQRAGGDDPLLVAGYHIANVLVGEDGLPDSADTGVDRERRILGVEVGVELQELSKVSRSSFTDDRESADLHHSHLRNQRWPCEGSSFSLLKGR